MPVPNTPTNTPTTGTPAPPATSQVMNLGNVQGLSSEESLQLKTVAENFSKATKGAIDWHTALGNISKSAPAIKQAALEIGLGVESLNGLFADSTRSVGTFTNEYTKLLTLGKLPALKGVESLIGVAGVGKIKDEFAKIEGIIKQYGGAADVVLNLQQNTLKLGAATGSLDAIYSNGRVNIEKLNNVSQKLAGTQIGLMGTLGATDEQAKDLMNQFMSMPGVLDKFIKGGADAVAITKDMQDVFRMGRAAGIPFTDLLSDMNSATRNLGASTEKSMEYIGRITQLTKLKAPLDLVRQYIGGVTDSLSKWGNTTEGTTKIFANLFPAFSKVGVSARDATEIIGSMAKSVGNLSVAQASLISQQTGGPGGLLGGYQLKQMISSGDTAGVLKKMQEALKAEFGGQTITLKDVKTEEQAQQYARQEQILGSGIYGDYGKDEATRSRIYEMMAQGTDVTEDSLGDVKTAIENTSKDGLELQKQSNTLASESLAAEQLTALNTAYDKAGAYKVLMDKVSEGKDSTGATARVRKGLEENLAATARGEPGVGAKETSDNFKPLKEYYENLMRGVGEKKVGKATTPPAAAQVEKGKGAEMGAAAKALAEEQAVASKITPEQQEAMTKAATQAVIDSLASPLKNPQRNIPIQVTVNLPSCPHCGESTPATRAIVQQ